MNSRYKLSRRCIIEDLVIILIWLMQQIELQKARISTLVGRVNELQGELAEVFDDDDEEESGEIEVDSGFSEH